MSTKVLNGLDLTNRPIVNVADPSSAQDAATKNYVDSTVRGLDWKQEVVAASTGNINLASPGANIDGIAMVANDRFLAKDQSTQSQNGIYVWNGAAVAATRALDADSATELSGATVTVQRGTVNADRVYRVTTDDPITVGTTAITFAQVGGGGGTTYVAGNGLTESPALTFNVGAGTGITVAADAISVDTAVVPRKFAANVGNGSLTSIAITHNLGTRDVHVTVYDSTTYEEVMCDIVHTDTNNVTLTFATAPASNAYRCVVVG
jgi:hypothetical protein